MNHVLAVILGIISIIIPTVLVVITKYQLYLKKRSYLFHLLFMLQNSDHLFSVILKTDKLDDAYREIIQHDFNELKKYFNMYHYLLHFDFVTDVDNIFSMLFFLLPNMLDMKSNELDILNDHFKEIGKLIMITYPREYTQFYINTDQVDL